ncbi:MAG: DUF5722 domain-containing protein [Planctomycetota bacterium]
MSNFAPKGTAHATVVALAMLLNAGFTSGHLFGDGIRFIEVDESTVRVGLPDLGQDVTLKAAGPHQNGIHQGDDVFHGHSHGQTITIDRFDTSGTDRLFQRYALLDASSQGVGLGRYATRLAKLKTAGVNGDWPSSIKGLQCVMDFEDAAQLGAAHVTLNVSITALLRRSKSEGTQVPEAQMPADWTFEVDGHQYLLDAKQVHLLDKQVGAATDRNMNTIAILLCRPSRGRTQHPLVHPDADVSSSEAKVAAVDTSSPEALRQYRAVVGFLGRRYSRPDQKYGRIGGYIVGNEVQSHWYWHNMGRQPATDVIRQYSTQLRATYYALRQQMRDPKIFVSLDHHWTSRHGKDPLKAMPGRQFIDALAKEIRSGGDLPWHVAWHPYPQDLFDPSFWDDHQATHSFDTAKITFKNIEVLPAYLERQELLYQGQSRRVILSEQGFHAGNDAQGEVLQAAAFAASFIRIAAIEGIDAYVLHRHVDHPREGGLKLGLRAYDSKAMGKKRHMHDVFQAAGTPRQEAAFRFALPLVGLDDWSGMLPRQVVELPESSSSKDRFSKQ